jgi:hypothetical protein
MSIDQILDRRSQRRVFDLADECATLMEDREYEPGLIAEMRNVLELETVIAMGNIVSLMQEIEDEDGNSSDPEFSKPLNELFEYANSAALA